MARYTLYGTFASGPTDRVGLVLSPGSEPSDSVLANLRPGEHRPPEPVDKRRLGQAPLLVDNSKGRHLCQSAAFLESSAGATDRFGAATLAQRLQARKVPA